MSDLIDRQAAIDALTTYIYNLYKAMAGKKMPTDKCRQAAESVLGELPTVQPNHNAEVRKMVDDLISRQAAIDAISCDITVTGRRNAELVAATIGAFADRIKALPPVQPEILASGEGELNVPVINVGDMISKQAAMERLMAQNVIMDGSEYHNGFNAGVNRAQEVIRNLPPVQPNRSNGHWIEITSGNHTYKCSVCGRLLVNITDGKNNVAKNYPYCHCGADMRGEA